MEKETQEIRTKKMTFGGVAQKSLIFEAGSSSLAPPASTQRTRTPSPGGRPAGTGPAPAPRPAPRIRRPSTTEITEDISIDEIRQQFRECKKKIKIGPVTLEHVRCMYVGLTNDRVAYSDHEVANGDRFRNARTEAAADFFRDELNMEEHMFKVLSAEFFGEATMATMLVNTEYGRGKTSH